MISLFKVTDLNFVENADNKDVLRFVPDDKISKFYNNRELIKRIFTEDIEVNPEPEPVIYPEVIQTLIDADAQTVADVAKILSLYNPDDISDILKALINTYPQPKTVEQICRNENILAYPYEKVSEIFDNYFFIWTKIGAGTITHNTNLNYTFSNAGVQALNVLPGTAPKQKIEINIYIKINDDTKSGYPIILYNSVDSTSTITAYKSIQYINNQFRLRRLNSNNGTAQNGTIEPGAPTYKNDDTAWLTWTFNTDGTESLKDVHEGLIISNLTSTSTFYPKHCRINANKAATATTYNIFSISRFVIFKYPLTFISTWKI